MSAVRHLARWVAWQVSNHAAVPPTYLAPASITVFSSDGSSEPSAA